MLSLVWTLMVLISLICGILLHRTGLLPGAVMEGAASGVQMTLSLAGPLCLWCGVSRLLEAGGLRDGLSALLRPVLLLLFPELKNNRKGLSALSGNVAANLLGLGSAATPMGIEACRAMGDRTGRATRDQCRLVVLNTASIQLLPTTVAALRAGLGCKTPLDILPCVLLTSLCSVAAGLIACRLLEAARAG